MVPVNLQSNPLKKEVGPQLPDSRALETSHEVPDSCCKWSSVSSSGMTRSLWPLVSRPCPKTSVVEATPSSGHVVRLPDDASGTRGTQLNKNYAIVFYMVSVRFMLVYNLSCLWYELGYRRSCQNDLVIRWAGEGQLVKTNYNCWLL